MNSFFTITKAAFLSGFNTNKKKNNQSSAFKMVGLIGIIFLALSFFYNYLITNMLNKSDINSFNYYLVAVMAVSSIMSLTISIFQMQSQIYRTKDYEFLETLPIRKTTIISSKILAVYLINIFEDAIIMVPALIFYIIYTHSVYGFIIGLISIFFVSLIPLLISSIIGTIVALISSRFKYKTVVTIIGYLLFIGLVFALSFSISFKMTSLEMNSEYIDLSGSSKMVPYLSLVLESLDISKFYLYLIFILINIASFALVVIFISLIYKKINSIEVYKGEGKYVREKEGLLKEKNYLLVKEIKSVVNRPNYLVNAFSGVFLFLIMSVVFMFIEPLMMEGGATSENSKMFVLMVPMMGMIASGVTSSTSASISIEGKSFELLLSYPINPMDLIKSKVKAALIIAFIPSIFIMLFDIVAGSIIMKTFDVIFVLQIIMLPSITIIYTAIIGMLCGLKWPKIEFETEAQVLKQSASVGFTMLFSIIPTMIFGIAVLVFNLISTGSNYPIIFELLGLVIPFVLFLILVIIFFNVLKKNAVKMFYNVMK